eukprot:328883-Rhodomonas_salina.2
MRVFALNVGTGVPGSTAESQADSAAGPSESRGASPKSSPTQPQPKAVNLPLLQPKAVNLPLLHPLLPPQLECPARGQVNHFLRHLYNNLILEIWRVDDSEVFVLARSRAIATNHRPCQRVGRRRDRDDWLPPQRRLPTGKPGQQNWSILGVRGREPNMDWLTGPGTGDGDRRVF